MDTTNQLLNSLTNFFGFWPIMGYVASALICILIGSFLTPILEPIVSKLFSRVNSAIFRKTKKMRGKWTHEWHVSSARFPEQNVTHNVILKQFGRRVSARYVVKDKNNNEYTYILKGKIENNTYISGEWFDLYAGNTYHGAFLLRINVNMNQMSGIWIGTSQDDNVKSGLWEWTREN